MPVLRLLLVLLACLAAGCAGYKLGGSKPAHLVGIETLQVPLVTNKTQMPRAGARATNALIDALTADGTYRIAHADRADARLEVTLHQIGYRQARATRFDVLRSEELQMEVQLLWMLVDADNPTKSLGSGFVTGRTLFFVDPNLQTSRQHALSDALQRASEALVARLADGF